MQSEQPAIRGQATPDSPGDANSTRPSEFVADWAVEQHAVWRRMVIFSAHREAVASAVISLYRAASASVDTPLQEAPLYLRRTQSSIMLYFSPEAAELCKGICDAFGSDPTERPRNLQACALITAD